MAPPKAAPIYLWHYIDSDNNYPGWNMTADGAGCAAFVHALDELQRLPDGRSQRLDVLAPTAAVLAVPGKRHPKVRVAKRLRLSLDRLSVRRFAITEDDRGVALAVGVDRVDELRDHVADIPRGRGDLAMHADDDATPGLWFWWLAR